MGILTTFVLVLAAVGVGYAFRGWIHKQIVALGTLVHGWFQKKA